MFPAARREAAALVLLVVASTTVRAWASRGVPTPWITPDEQIYGLLGQGLWRHGSLSILGGPTPYYSSVVPAIAGAPLSLGDLAFGYSLLKELQALVMSLAAVPVYYWTRSLARQRWALAAAALTVALPGLAYSGLVMSEVVFYPVFVLAAWTAARVLVSPTRTRQLVFLAATGLAVATRLQAIVLVLIFMVALALQRARFTRFALTLGAFAAFATAWISWRLATGASLLAGYKGAAGSYAAGRAIEFVWWHFGDLALLCGVFPLAALVCLLRLRDESAQLRAYVAVALSSVVCVVVEVGVFASRQVDLLAERNLIALAPLLFVGFAAWLDRGAPATRWHTLLVPVAALLLPLGRFVKPDGLPDAFSLIPLYQLRQLTSLTVLEIVFCASVIAATICFFVVRGRLLLLLPAVLLVLLGAGSVSASREISSQSHAQQLRLLGPERRWIDDAATGPVAYVYDGSTYWDAVWENAFWNRRVRWVLDLPGTSVPGPIPQQHIDVELDGAVARGPFAFAVVPSNYALRGQLVASAPLIGNDRQGFGLWRVAPPLRISTITSGLLPDGDVNVQAALTVYGCTRGTFSFVFLVKEPQTVTISGNDVRPLKRTFGSPSDWRLVVPVRPSTSPNRVCRIIVQSDALLGTTRFTFDRG